MKTYVNPMLQVVSISKKDIIATSDFGVNNTLYEGVVKSPGQRGLFDPYDPYNAEY